MMVVIVVVPRWWLWLWYNPDGGAQEKDGGFGILMVVRVSFKAPRFTSTLVLLRMVVVVVMVVLQP